MNAILTVLVALAIVVFYYFIAVAGLKLWGFINSKINSYKKSKIH